MVVRLEKGKSYIYSDDDIIRLWTFFSQHMDKSINGFVISKCSPSIIRKRYDMTCPICQINFMDKKNGVDPTDLNSFARLIEYIRDLDSEFLVLIDGLEFIKCANDIDWTKMLIRKISSLIIGTKITVIYSLAKEGLDNQEYSCLEKILIPLDLSGSDSYSFTRGNKVFVGIGKIEIVKSPYSLVTYLGSCVGVALYDEKTKTGGLAHIVLPDSRGKDDSKYADVAIPRLLDGFRKKGISISALRCVIAGGASMMGESGLGIGKKNLEKVRSLLHKEGVVISEEFLGEKKVTNMRIDTKTGKISSEKIICQEWSLKGISN